MSDQASDGGSGASRDGGSGGTPTRPRLRDFWTDLPREGKFLLSTIIIDFIGTGLAMPFLVVYLHEVRGERGGVVRAAGRVAPTRGRAALFGR